MLGIITTCRPFAAKISNNVWKTTNGQWLTLLLIVATRL